MALGTRTVRRRAGLKTKADKNPADLRWYEVTATAALLDGAGTVAVKVPTTATAQYKVRDIKLIGGGTNFASGGDRTLSLTDGTTTWTTVPNASLETAPTASVPWGNTAIPFLTGTADTASAAGATIRFQYAGGTTDHSATGSIKFHVLLERVA